MPSMPSRLTRLTGGGIGRTTLIALAVVVLAGGALRGWQAAHPGTARQSLDEIAYIKLAKSLAIDHSYSYGGPEAHPLHWPPGAPALFALGYLLHRDREIRAAYWLQAGAGTLTILAAFALAFLLGGAVAGVAAAVLVAFYPPFIALSGELLSETLGALLLISALLAAVAAWRARARWWWFALAGVLFGAAILTRADFVLAPVLPAALMSGAALVRRDRALALRSGGVFLVATVLAIAPWIAYASHREGGLVLVTEGDASALFVGTYLPGEGTTYGMKRALGDKVRERFPELRGIENYKLPAAPVLQYVAETTHPGLPRNEALRKAARANLREYALGEPLRFAVMMLDKFRRTWILSSRVGRDAPERWVRIGHGAIVVFGLLIGMLAIFRLRSVALAMLLSIVLYSALVHAVFVAKPRYNLPPLPLLMVCACAATAMLVKARLSASREAAPGNRLSRADEA